MKSNLIYNDGSIFLNLYVKKKANPCILNKLVILCKMQGEYIVACHLLRGSKLRWRENIAGKAINNAINTRVYGGSRQYAEPSNSHGFNLLSDMFATGCNQLLGPWTPLQGGGGGVN